MPSSVVSAGIGLVRDSKNAKAEKKARKEAEKAQEENARNQAAAEAGISEEREYSTDPTSSRMQGIQATLLASRRKRSEGGGSTLGS